MIIVNESFFKVCNEDVVISCAKIVNNTYDVWLENHLVREFRFKRYVRVLDTLSSCLNKAGPIICHN